MSKYDYVAEISKELSTKGYKGLEKNSKFLEILINYIFKKTRVSDWKIMLKEVKELEDVKKGNKSSKKELGKYKIPKAPKNWSLRCKK